MGTARGVHGVKAVRSRAEDAMEHAFECHLGLYFRSEIKGLLISMFHGWRWAALMYNGVKSSNDVRVLEHKNLHT